MTHLNIKVFTDHHQLTLILDVLGTPSLDDFYNITSHRSREYLRALPFKKRRPFGTMYPNANTLAIDLLDKCLTFNPNVCFPSASPGLSLISTVSANRNASSARKL